MRFIKLIITFGIPGTISKSGFLVITFQLLAFLEMDGGTDVFYLSVPPSRGKESEVGNYISISIFYLWRFHLSSFFGEDIIFSFKVWVFWIHLFYNVNLGAQRRKRKLIITFGHPGIILIKR